MMVILSPPRTSTSGRAPVLRATIRFWIKVESLNRPPTLFTIAFSLRSSSILFPFEKLAQNRLEFIHRDIQIVIDYLKMVFGGTGQFFSGRCQPLLNLRFILAGPLAQSLFIGLKSARPQEHEHGLREPAPHRSGPLHVDIQDHTAALLSTRLDFTLQGAIAITMHFGPFQESAGLHFAVKTLRGPKIIMDPVLLSRAWRPGGRRHRQLQRPRAGFQNPIDDRGLAAAAGPRNYD